VSAQSSKAASNPASLAVEPFRGGSPWLFAGGAAGVVLLIVSIVGFAVDARPAYFSYLVAFAYWCGIAFAALILLMIFHATHARWMTILRRPIEAMASTLPLFLVLLIPLLIGMKHVYSWVEPAAAVPPFSKEALHLIEHKRAWLNTGFFIGRAIFYLVLATIVAQLLQSWSLRQDKGQSKESGYALLERMRRLSAGGLPFIALSFTFAAFDWLMSLNPTWYSTIFGVYFFAGSFGAALSLLAIITDLGRVQNVFSGGLNVEHTHNIGKLMLAFTCFWTYIAFSQLMLIWIAGLPEEIPFYITRFNEGWRWVGVFLMLFHFFVPFGALLSRSLKRDPRKLASVAVMILLVHYIDVFWLVMPTLNVEGFSVHWTNFTAFLGVGLLAIAFGVFRLRGRLPIPVKDPYLGESLRYRQP
jgi:hypothetical protein